MLLMGVHFILILPKSKFQSHVSNFELKKSFDHILCVFQERLKRTQEE